MKILLKGAYEGLGSSEGFRVLVDRLRPRCKKKAYLHLDAWAKDLSPSTELRKWFDHDPKHWLEFCKRYEAEFAAPEMKHSIVQIVCAAQKHTTMTLLYGAKDAVHNEAVVLQPIFKRAAAKVGEA